MPLARTAIRAAVLAALFFSALPAAGAPDFKTIPKLQEIKERPAAPDFMLPDPGGKTHSIKDYRGKVVFLNFWATWCESCRDEMPSMERLYREFKGKEIGRASCMERVWIRV